MRSARGPRHGPRGLLAYAGAMTYTLVLLRHGESDWNAKNLFTGWVDVPLTEKGEAEAIAGGELMKEARSEEHTSELQSRGHLVCRHLLEKKKTKVIYNEYTDTYQNR